MGYLMERIGQTEGMSRNGRSKAPPQPIFSEYTGQKKMRLMALAAAVPDLELLIGLVGAIFFSTLGLLIPVVVETVHKWEHDLGTLYWLKTAPPVECEEPEGDQETTLYSLVKDATNPFEFVAYGELRYPTS
ncbi:hypothetical protein EVAR_47067_1 [Eumeta japonica]|uniref:Uncharacterized protein n=1 Tax=Eumeta variegata TaxID=151549 RepID=A0A4C1WM20_EUMVA|nr:hypothetical protein EVAR_47067_1 [Eumeta japonica]